MQIKTKNTFIFLSFIIIGLVFALPVLASINDGTIDATDKYAWGENVGWINFGTSEGNVHITDSGLTGYAWGENIGWISLNCSNDNSCNAVDYKVANDGSGNLSGYAWGENVGWINFNPDYGGVSISSMGEFSGYAWGENIGWIIFNCANTSSCATVDYKIKTDYRPKNARNSASAPSLDAHPSDASPLDAPRPLDLIVEKLKEIPEKLIPKIPSFLKPKPQEQNGEVPKKPFWKKITDLLKPLAPRDERLAEIPTPELVPLKTPFAFQKNWNLISPYKLNRFVFAPLPRDLSNLVGKLPALQNTFTEIGIDRMADLRKLKMAYFKLPSLEKITSLKQNDLNVGMVKVPTEDLLDEQKEKIPSEIVFARAGGKAQMDLPINLSVNEKGKAEQRIKTVARQPLHLTVKPERKVKMVIGYIMFKSRAEAENTPDDRQELLGMRMSLKSILESIISAKPVLAQEYNQKEVENRLVLKKFEYTDPDGDGIYSAEVEMPVAAGEYEIITVMDYDDPTLMAKEIRLITVVDPEGYIYEKNGNKETRIPEAKITLYRQNPETNQYEMWRAEDYQQENPQTTQTTGNYSFLVPEGKYYLLVTAKGYKDFKSDAFEVKEGEGIHNNIEIQSKYGFIGKLDWKIFLLIALTMLIAFNFYKDRIRAKRT